jgi:hypothetical protein
MDDVFLNFWVREGNKMIRLSKNSVITLLISFGILILVGALVLNENSNQSFSNGYPEDVVSVKDFGAKGDGKTNDSKAIQAAISHLNQTGGGVLYFPSGNYIMTSPIVINNNIRIKGSGKYNSVINIKGRITAIDLSSKHAKLGVAVESIGIVGTNTKGQIAIDAYYLVNGSYIRDVRIENVDTGIRLTKSWYSSFSDIYIRNCLSYGLHLRSLSAAEQVNGVRFSSVFIQGAKNAVFLEGKKGSVGVHFDSSTFEKNRETAVVSEGFSPLSFTNCYFEDNYQKGRHEEKLKWMTPIDVQVKKANIQTLVKFDSCYFSRSNSFLSSSEKTSIYLGEDTLLTIINSRFVSGSREYLDANIFSVSKYKPVILNVSQDGSAKKNLIIKRNF